MHKNKQPSPCRACLLCALPVVLATVFAVSGCADKSDGAGMPAAMRDMGQTYAENGGSGGNVSYGGTPLSVEHDGNVTYNGQAVPARRLTSLNTGYALNDGAGGVIWSPGSPRQPQNPAYADARELKLKVRELTDQLVQGTPFSGLKDGVAVPTSFVSQENFEQTSPFGRFIAEQFYYELSQRGVPLREYRIDGNLRVTENGEFILKKTPATRQLASCNYYIVGTYYNDSQTIFVNARLITSSGQVLRAGQLLMPSTSLTKRMLAGGSGSKIKMGGTMQIKDFGSQAMPAPLTPVDMGQDIH